MEKANFGELLKLLSYEGNISLTVCDCSSLTCTLSLITCHVKTTFSTFIILSCEYFTVVNIDFNRNYLTRL